MRVGGQVCARTAIYYCISCSYSILGGNGGRKKERKSWLLLTQTLHVSIYLSTYLLYGPAMSLSLVYSILQHWLRTMTSLSLSLSLSLRSIQEIQHPKGKSHMHPVQVMTESSFKPFVTTRSLQSVSSGNDVRRAYAAARLLWINRFYSPLPLVSFLASVREISPSFLFSSPGSAYKLNLSCF